MRKRKGTRYWITALLCCILTATTTKAQIGEHRNDLALGINAGYTLNKMSFNPSIEQVLKGAPSFGLSIRYTCEKYFKSLCALQMEVNFANLGWKENIETSTDTYSRDMYYIQIPFLARMGWGYEKRGAMFYAIAGPQVAFCIGEESHKGGEFSDATLALRPGSVYQQYSMPVEHKFEYGITGGVGIEVNTKIGHFLLDARYYYGLSDIYSNGKKDVFGRSANGTIVARFSYLFDVIKTKRED